MGPSLFSFIILIVFFVRLILTCRLWVIYVREDNYSNVEVMITRLIWTIYTSMSSVRKKADKLNLSLSPTDYCLEWSTELFPTIINEKHPFGIEVTECEGSTPCSMKRRTCQSQSVSCRDMLSVCTWIYFCFFCHLCELIHFIWGIHCITLYYDFTYTHVIFNTCSNSYIIITSNV